MERGWTREGNNAKWWNWRGCVQSAQTAIEDSSKTKSVETKYQLYPLPPKQAMRLSSDKRSQWCRPVQNHQEAKIHSQQFCSLIAMTNHRRKPEQRGRNHIASFKARE